MNENCQRNCYRSSEVTNELIMNKKNGSSRKTKNRWSHVNTGTYSLSPTWKSTIEVLTRIPETYWV